MRQPFANHWPISPYPCRSPALIGCFIVDRQYFQEIGLLDEGMEVYGGENVELGIRVSRVSHPQVLVWLLKGCMNLGGGEMGLKDGGHSLILNIQFLTMVHLCVIRAKRDGTETQDGTYRIFRKKRTSETVWLRVGTWKS